MPKFVDSHVGSEVHRREKDKEEKKRCLYKSVFGGKYHFFLISVISFISWLVTPDLGLHSQHRPRCLACAEVQL